MMNNLYKVFDIHDGYNDRMEIRMNNVESNNDLDEI